MRALYTERFLKSYAQSPAEVQKAFDKQIQSLLSNLRHPSLRAKKYDEARDIWQARVTRGWRFYFTIEGDTYHILEIKPHPK
jgi:mRNA-degrading endonuclease RelE of RelBE toxin-antitoxin system